MSQDTGSYSLDVDASNWAAGAVLQQEQDGLLRVIGYASKAFTGVSRCVCYGAVVSARRLTQFVRYGVMSSSANMGRCDTQRKVAMIAVIWLARLALSVTG